MTIQRLQVKNFRCFSNKIIDLSAPITLIQGQNGSGKTSLLEALYYLCYLRSFRAHHTREMIALGAKEFFLKATLYDDTDEAYHELQAGFSSQKKIVKYDERSINSFKELMDYYRVVCLFEDDLALLKDGPEQRRTFIDQAFLLLYPDKLSLLREFKKVLDNRNALLYQAQGKPSALHAYQVWTEQLWLATQELIRVRQDLLRSFEIHVNQLLAKHFNGEFQVTLEYKPKNGTLGESYQDFSTRLDVLQGQEVRFGRSLFGAHLDDVAISLGDKQTRLYASRGQQKLVVILLKIAFLTELTHQRGKTLFIIDDFMTDFDEYRTKTLITLLTSLNVQLIFTSPAQNSYADQILTDLGAVCQVL